MYRTQVYLRESQHLALKREAARRNKSMTELLRDLIDEQLAPFASRAGANLRGITALGSSRGAEASMRHDEIFARGARARR